MTFSRIHIVEGVAAPLDQPNVDTGLILPARFLRRPRSGGYQDYLFHDQRFDSNGAEILDFVLNQPAFRNSCILIAAGNFGAGSSREQAPWGLLDYGIRCVVAQSFGETFYANACNTGVLPVQLGSSICDRLREQLHAAPGAKVRVDLARQEVICPDGAVYAFLIDAFRKRRLLDGLDDIGLTLESESAISAYENGYRRRFPWLFTEPG